jgi:hypothetical protein
MTRSFWIFRKHESLSSSRTRSTASGERRCPEAHSSGRVRNGNRFVTCPDFEYRKKKNEFQRQKIGRKPRSPGRNIAGREGNGKSRKPSSPLASARSENHVRGRLQGQFEIVPDREQAEGESDGYACRHGKAVVRAHLQPGPVRESREKGTGRVQLSATVFSMEAWP